VAALTLIMTSLPASAGDYTRKGTFHVGGGFNFPVGDADTYFNDSGTLSIGGGRHLNKQFSLAIEWTHNWMAIDPEVVDRAQEVYGDSVTFDDTRASQWSVCLNLYRRFNADADIVPWVTGGVGYYKRNLQITQTVMYYYPPIWDPWWGWIDGGWAPGEAITGSRETSGFGWNAGIGLDMEIDSGASLFIDARYHEANVDGVKLQMVPIQAGIRW
jgi:hypothetical protein